MSPSVTTGPAKQIQRVFETRTADLVKLAREGDPEAAGQMYRRTLAALLERIGQLIVQARSRREVLELGLLRDAIAKVKARFDDLQCAVSTPDASAGFAGAA